jgi:CRISPR-associated protein Cmr1
MTSPIHHIEASFDITTPMFIGDANQQPTGITFQSIKGALRFWWRALNWPRLLADKKSIVKALKDLHQEEALLFGAPANENKPSETGGQGLFLAIVTQKIEKTGLFEGANNSQKYLLGIGLSDKNIKRKAILKGRFDFKLFFKRNATKEQINSVCDAIYAFGLLGGLGTRARHGIGSVSLKRLEIHKPEKREYTIPKEKTEYLNSIQFLTTQYIRLCDISSFGAPLTAFSTDTRIDVSLEDPCGQNLLSLVGDKQLLYRSYGYKGKQSTTHKIYLSNGNRVGSKKPFADDHDLFVEGRGRAKTAPKRAVFGLPHNYFYSSTRKSIEINFLHNNEQRRRSSPLLLHIHHLGDLYIAVHCFMPGLFLPNNTKLTVRRHFNQAYEIPAPQISTSKVITDYLDTFKDKTTIYGR